MQRENHAPPLRTPPPPAQRPTGILQDAGEVEVTTADHGQVRHRFAMVVAFNSEEDLRRALDDHHCTYRDGQAVQERIAHG